MTSRHPGARRPRPTEPPGGAIHSPLLQKLGIRDRAALDRIRFFTPTLLGYALEPIARARAETAKEQRARAFRVGQASSVTDQADVSMEDATDPASPNRRVRRARRADPLLTLQRTGAITGRQFDAADALRDEIQAAAPRMPAFSTSEIHTAPWASGGVSSGQLAACASVRQAFDAIERRDRLVVMWLMSGGTLGGYQVFARTHHHTATASLRRALDALIRHFFLGAAT